MEAFQLKQDAKDIRRQAPWLIRQAIVRQADPYRVREILLEAIRFNRKINWDIFIDRVDRERIECIKIVHRLLQQAIALEEESDRLMNGRAGSRQNSSGIFHTSFLNAARSI